MVNLMSRNGTTVEVDYYPQFEEMKHRCAVGEEQWVTMTKFINGLRDHLKGEVSLRHLESSVEAIQKALEIDKYKQSSHSHRWTSQAGKSMPFKVVAFQENSYSKGQAQFNHQPVNFGKGSSITSPLVHSSSSPIVCHKCHERGHPTSRCPHHTLTITLGNLQEDEPINETLYPVVGDTATESLRVSMKRMREAIIFLSWDDFFLILTVILENIL
ncbi:hypothetical protein Cgig2_026683 [Carnegiea gigantea]|uniref:CCHC-type domain-containing protein n=1 Tax=Carnegiea gigantea TaxID=171969 RepID=A0A9Q1JYT8_9CARY|nr:hypothetical protein Cgig2_026683 [Carnegiea gigantea]